MPPIRQSFITFEDMKSLLTGSALLLFLAAGLRVPLHAHYCGGKLQDFKLYVVADSCCEHEKHNTPHYTSPCCKEKRSTYTLPDYKHIDPSSVLNTLSQVANYQAVRSSLFTNYSASFCRVASLGRSPPSTLPLFLLYATLRL